MTPPASSSKAHPRAQGVALLMSLTVVLVGWLLSAPPGASPDDGYHLASIWCAEGFHPDRCLEDPGAANSSQVLVPFSTVDLVCFQQEGQRSAACSIDEQASDLQVFTAVKNSNIQRERPNLYYLAMHQLIGDDFSASMARMRGANVALAVILVALTAVAAAPPLRRGFLLTTVVVSVPLGLFLVSSLNTSAWGLVGLGTLWANGLTAISHPGRIHRVAGAALGAAGAAIAFGSRSEAVVHIGITMVALLAVWWTSEQRPSFPWRSRQPRVSGMRRILLIVTLLLTTLAALVSFAPRSAGLADVPTNLAAGYDRLAARGLGDPLLAIAFEVPSLWTGALGHIWGLGALDTPIPTLATLPLSGMFVALLALGLHRAARGRFVAAIIIGGALFAFPTLALLQAGVLVYEQLQPRQFMPLLYLLLGIALFRTRSEPELRLGAGMKILTSVLLGIAHSIALLVTMRRHISGLTEFRYVSFTSPIEWWWASGPSPNVVWAAASVTFFVAVTLIISMFPTEREDGGVDSDASGRGPTLSSG